MLPNSIVMASADEALRSTTKKANFQRLTRLLMCGGVTLLREKFDSIHSPATLPSTLSNPTIQTLLKSSKITRPEWNSLYPSPGLYVKSTDFDITLTFRLLRTICHLSPPATGWDSLPNSTDHSLEADLARIKHYRNQVYGHSSTMEIPDAEFVILWREISEALLRIAGSISHEERDEWKERIEKFLCDPLTPDEEQCAQELQHWYKQDMDVKDALEKLQQEFTNHWEKVRQSRSPTGTTTAENVERDVQQLKDQMSNMQVSKPTVFGLCSYLPDEVTNVFGRDKEIRQVVELIKTGKEAAVLITGGPGFGKTTVANKAAYELAKPEQDRAVFFCNIMSMKTVDEVATRMSLTCSKNLTQLPDNPRLWLLNWGKQLESRVIFVLDNADDAFDREGDDGNEFWRFLDDCRTLSKQNVNFIITSRLECNPLKLQTKNVRLGCLSMEEANEVVSSRLRVSNLGSIERKLYHAETLVELCDYVPLALCVAGSLLSKGVYTEDELIKRLEEEPTDVLQCDRRPTNETSVAKSIMTSLVALDDCEQQAIILLCSFPGSFDADAAKFLISKACSAISENQSMSILGELIDRSLVEQSRSHRYEIHALIKASAKKFGQKKYPQLFAKGEKMACAYFLSCLYENAHLYWGKDTCKASIESFSKDRHNFEYFLDVHAKGMDKDDPGIIDICKMFHQEFLQTCMYLEMCLSPRVYVELLERLLKSFSGAEFQPVRVVEIMCLLGHEMRKVGQREEYRDYMEKAKKLYSEKSCEFAGNKISEVFYMNSYADYVSKRGDPANNDEIWELSQSSLKTCDKNMLEEDHPERASTLLLAGRFAKRMGKRSEANGKLQEALKLFLERLGEHVRTVNALKEIGDFFLSGETEENLEKALSYYKRAEKMMDGMGMENNPQIIHILKNYGVCVMKRENFPEAKEYLERALLIAERELKADHNWKVMIKSTLSLLHGKIGNVVGAIYLMKEALTMCYKLKIPIKKLGNSRDVLEFLNRHKKDFPKTEFPR